MAGISLNKRNDVVIKSPYSIVAAIILIYFRMSKSCMGIEMEIYKP